MVPLVPLALCLGALGALALRDRTTSAHHSGLIQMGTIGQ